MVKRWFAYWLEIYIALVDYLGRLSKYLFKALAKRFKINKISFKETFGEEKVPKRGLIITASLFCLFVLK